MKRFLILGLALLITVPAFADFKGDMNKYFGIQQVPGATPYPDLANGVKVGGIALTTNGLDSTTTGITAHAGGGQGSATALTTVFNNVTTCTSAGDSVKLLTAAAGTRQVVKNSGATALAVFPNTSDSINSGSANASVTLQLGEELEFRAISSVVWTTIETIPRSKLQEDALAVFDLPYYGWLDGSTGDPLLGASETATGKFNTAAVGCGFILGISSFLTDNETVSPTMGTVFALPENYVATGDVKVVVTAKVTNAATTKTVDVQCYKANLTAGTLGSDICATAIQTMTTSFVEYTFVITAATLSAGDYIQIVVAGVVTDAAGGSTTAMQISGIKVLADVKG